MKDRAQRGKLPVFAAGSSSRIESYARPEKAARWELLGIWRREYDPATGALVGYRKLSVDELKGDQLQPSMEMAAEMDHEQMELNVSPSSTRGLSELRRMERAKATGEMEDRAERVQAKVRVYQMVGSARGDILRAWPICA